MKRHRTFLFLLAAVLCQSAPADDALRKKLGQLFIIGFQGSVVTDTLYADLIERNVGGVILSYVNGNLPSPAEIVLLTADIRSAAPIQPFICADQEGGRVARLSDRNGFSATHTAYTLGMVFQSTDSTYAQAKLMSSWLAQCGINLNFAPVVDVAVTPYNSTMYYQRLFSDDPLVVAAHAKKFIEGSHELNIMTTLKHFPGGGAAKDLLPFRKLIDSSKVDLVMMSHNRVAGMDPVNYASLSSAVIEGWLRDTLGYTGVVITDDLYQMATSKTYGYGTAARMALNAGNDILLYAGSIVNGNSLVRLIIDTLETDVLEGRISMARVDEAYNRVLALKSAYITSVAERSANQGVRPGTFELSQNYPNPFNPSTTFEFRVEERSNVKLAIYDILGREVAVLVNDERPAGMHTVLWNAAGMPSGVYFCTLSAGNRMLTRKLVLVR